MTCLAQLPSTYKSNRLTAPAVAELLRENKRALDKAIRELDRERTSLQTQEKKLIAEIKKTAKQGQMVGLFECCLSPFSHAPDC